jgi:hypothetical protein
MYKNRIMYSTLQTADPYFYAKVLFALDSTLQAPWRSCSASNDRLSVNDSILRLQDVESSIL